MRKSLELYLRITEQLFRVNSILYALSSLDLLKMVFPDIPGEWLEEYLASIKTTENQTGLPIQHLDHFRNFLINKNLIFLEGELKKWLDKADELKLVDKQYQHQDEHGNINAEEIACKLLTTILYKYKRKPLDACFELFDDAYSFLFLLDQFLIIHQKFSTLVNSAQQKLKELLDIRDNPALIRTKINELSSILSKKETESGTYYGSYLSDNSDSEEERESSRNPINRDYRNYIASQRLHGIKDYLPTTGANEHLYQTACKEGKIKRRILGAPSTKTLGENINSLWKINRTNFAEQQYRDLMQLNQYLKEGVPLKEATSRVTTKFVVAQYRGIAYSVKEWGKTSRNHHRSHSNNEVLRPQFSASVYRAAGYTISDFFKLPVNEREQLQEILTVKAIEQEKQLISARSTKPVIIKTAKGDDGYYLLRSSAHAIQSIYTQNYDGFHALISNANSRPPALQNDKNPFVSTGNVPTHALEYAYGSKYYDSAKETRLRPRWRQDGRVERPYSGRVYVSLHSVDNYDEHGPLNIPHLFYQGELAPNVINNILHERETTFSSWIKPGHVVFQHSAKYPSFHGEYKEIYLYKFGLTRPLYELFQIEIKKHKPHTPESKHFKMLLSDWMCCYHESRLIDEARRLAEENQTVLVYRNQDGSFGLEPDAGNTIGSASSPDERYKKLNAGRQKTNEYRRELGKIAAQNDRDIAAHFLGNPNGMYELKPGIIERLKRCVIEKNDTDYANYFAGLFQMTMNAQQNPAVILHF